MAAKELLPHYNGQVVEIRVADAAYTFPAVPSLLGLMEQGGGSGWWLHWFQEARLGWSPRVHLSLAQQLDEGPSMGWLRPGTLSWK